ncbi:hypothetical protein Pr1d_25540 [Bythopirellula goksoeyrii]|uniref:Uncharacterized protein n=1 Tax=Bythopirellula goksoeyrii TaxID=1400387 RepID=A0A5B9QBV0_9BACT|nr:hypothetical protein Pr1d_25540 [Bythopirellula goksoeyrii]
MRLQAPSESTDEKATSKQQLHLPFQLDRKAEQRRRVSKLIDSVPRIMKASELEPPRPKKNSSCQKCGDTTPLF